MAKSVDEITLKVGVEGAASLDNLDNKLGNIDKSTKATSESLKQFNIRNVAYQVQDLAVQLSMGTSAFIAIGQQLPQLLSGFGVAGAVIGAVAAVAIPLLQQGLKVLGVDMRNLSEITKDLSNEINKNQEAQRLNASSIGFLTYSYGPLAEAAKEYFTILEQTTRIKVGIDAKKNLDELLKTYSAVYDSLQKNNDEIKRFEELTGKKAPEWRVNPTLNVEAWAALKAKINGLTLDQANELGKRLRDIDTGSPEKTSKALSEITSWLSKASIEAGNFERVYEKVIQPLEEANKLVLEQAKNIKAAAIAASDLNTRLMNLETPALADINAAKRNFDQITAIRKEGELKFQQFKFQLDAKTAEDGVGREKELAAFKLKNNQEVADKIKDFVKSQDEAYRSSVLQNKTKQDQLTLQGEILKLTEEGRLSAFNTLQLETDLLTNANQYQEALRGIAEQRRKNIIDASQASKLEKEAAGIREQADQNAYSAAERRQKSFLETQTQILEQDKRRLALGEQTAIMSDREAKNAEALFNLNEERLKQIRGLESLNDPVLRITKEKEINAIYAERVESLKKQQEQDKAIQENFSAGWSKAFANYKDDAENKFKQAQAIFQSVTKNMEDMFVKFAQTGKLEWKSFVNNMLEVLLRSQIQQLIAKLFGAASGGLGDLFSLPGKASGGAVTGGSPYIVGEAGPELFVPNGSGNIIPNNQLAMSGGGTNVVYNINAVDAMSFRQMLAQDPSFLYAVSEQGRRRIPGSR